MKYLVLSFIVSLLFISSFAQTTASRESGYKGSISIIDQGGVFVGLETSHGYRLSQHHYLGVGGGAFVFPNGKGYPSFAEAFLEYQAFFSDKSSSPVSSVKAGYIRALKYGELVNGYDNMYLFEQGLSIQPSLGWNWDFTGGCGITLSAGANIVFPVGRNPGNKALYALPTLAVSFNF